MNITLIYLNQKPVEHHVKQAALVVLQQNYDFSRGIIMHQFFRIIPTWPARDVIDKMPLHFQCEEVTLKDNKLRTIRQVVIETTARRVRTPSITEKSS